MDHLFFFGYQIMQHWTLEMVFCFMVTWQEGSLPSLNTIFLYSMCFSPVLTTNKCLVSTLPDVMTSICK